MVLLGEEHMAKTNHQKLEEAILAGDLEAAKLLIIKIKKPKSKPRELAVRLPAQKKPKKNITLTPKETTVVEEEGIFRTQGLQPNKNRTFIGEDGNEHNYGRRETLKITNFVNKYKVEDIKNPKEAKIDNILKKTKLAPRNSRPPAKTVKLRCSICSDMFETSAAFAETVDGEAKIRCNKPSCVRGI